MKLVDFTVLSAPHTTSTVEDRKNTCAMTLKHEISGNSVFQALSRVLPGDRRKLHQQ